MGETQVTVQSAPVTETFAITTEVPKAKTATIQVCIFKADIDIAKMGKRIASSRKSNKKQARSKPDAES